jgi:hypothetical protein
MTRPNDDLSPEVAWIAIGLALIVCAIIAAVLILAFT